MNIFHKSFHETLVAPRILRYSILVLPQGYEGEVEEAVREEGKRTPVRRDSQTVLQVVRTPTRISEKDSSSSDSGLKEVSINNCYSFAGLFSCCQIDTSFYTCDCSGLLAN